MEQPTLTAAAACRDLVEEVEWMEEEEEEGSAELRAGLGVLRALLLASHRVVESVAVAESVAHREAPLRRLRHVLHLCIHSLKVPLHRQLQRRALPALQDPPSEVAAAAAEEEEAEAVHHHHHHPEHPPPVEQQGQRSHFQRWRGAGQMERDDGLGSLGHSICRVIDGRCR